MRLLSRFELILLRIRKVLALLTDPFYLKAYWRLGVVPAIEHNIVLRRLDCDFIVDAGANRGQFSLLCRRVRPQARVVAFEPLEAPSAIYTALFKNDRHVRLYRSALGLISGTVNMNVAGADDSSSILPISEIQTMHYPGTGAVATCEVQIGPLSNFVSEAELGAKNLFKIDVQGYELEVLKSAESLLPRFDWIYVECSFLPFYEGQPLADDVIAYLAGHGFQLVGQFNQARASVENYKVLQADFLFENVGRN